MNISGTVRKVIVDAGYDGDFGGEVVAHLRDLMNQGAVAMVGPRRFHIHRLDDTTTLPGACRLRVLFTVDTLARKMTSEGIQDVKDSLFEALTIFVIGRRGFLVVSPDVRLRSTKLGDATLDGFAVMRAWLNLKFPVELASPGKDRKNTFFVRKLLDVAKANDLKLTEVKVGDLLDCSLSEELDLYNPDKPKETLGRRFMAPALRDLDTVTIRSGEKRDLSHNPLVRGVIGAGDPQYMRVVKVPPASGPKKKKPRQEVTLFRRKRTDKLSATVPGKHPLPPEQLRKVDKALAAGDYECDETDAIDDGLPKVRTL